MDESILDVFTREYGLTCKFFLCHRIRDKITACRMGYVYIAQAGDLYKIGYTEGCRGIISISDRIHSTSVLRGIPLEFRHALKTVCGRGLERECHIALRDRLIEHELFRLTDEDYGWLTKLESANGTPIEHIYSIPERRRRTL